MFLKGYLVYLLLVWGSFRYFFHLPAVIEELWFKPAIWLTPLFWWNFSKKTNRMKFFEGGVLKSIGLGLVVGAFYYLIFGRLKPLNFNLDILGITLATAITEELVFSGFIFGYLQRSMRKTYWSLVVIGLIVVLSRVPVWLWGFHLSGSSLYAAAIFSFAIGMIHAYIRLVSKNVLSSVVARWCLNIMI